MRLDKKIGVSYRQLSWWAARGYLNESSSYPRTFSETEMRIAKLMGMLTRGGMTPIGASLVARQMIETNKRGVDLGEGIRMSIDISTWNDIVDVSQEVA